jgi:hypothetical protein
MNTLDYGSDGTRSKMAIRTFAVFAPTLSLIALYLGTWLSGDTSNLLLFIVLAYVLSYSPVASAVVTAALLVRWRQRLNIITLIFGWVIVALTAAASVWTLRDLAHLRVMSP